MRGCDRPPPPARPDHVHHRTAAEQHTCHLLPAQADNDAVYAGVASPLVRDAAAGGYATCLMYGQTGSGKVRPHDTAHQEDLVSTNAP